MIILINFDYQCLSLYTYLASMLQTETEITSVSSTMISRTETPTQLASILTTYPQTQTMSKFSTMIISTLNGI